MNLSRNKQKKFEKVLFSKSFFFHTSLHPNHKLVLFRRFCISHLASTALMLPIAVVIVEILTLLEGWNALALRQWKIFNWPGPMQTTTTHLQPRNFNWIQTCLRTPCASTTVQAAMQRNSLPVSASLKIYGILVLFSFFAYLNINSLLNLQFCWVVGVVVIYIRNARMDVQIAFKNGWANAIFGENGCAPNLRKKDIFQEKNFQF